MEHPIDIGSFHGLTKDSFHRRENPFDRPS
jgi:hypothetical protein